MIRASSFAILLALAAAAPASAQAVETFGLKLGRTFSTVETDLPSEDPMSRQGHAGVLFAQWNGPGRTSLVTEAGYAERGYERVTGGGPDVIDGNLTYIDRRMQYVSLAAMAKVPVVAVGPASAYAVAGPRMNTLLGSRRGEDLPGYDYRLVTWDGTAGIGVEAVRGMPLLVEARYSFGLNDAFNGDGWRGSAYHRALDLVVGVRF